MLNIKIYGTGTSGHQYLMQKLQHKLEEAKIDYKIVSITDVNVFIENKIHSIPAVQIDDGEILELNPKEEYHIKTRNLIQKVLNSKNYGQMKRILFATDFSESSDNAFRFASSIAKKMDGFVQVLHAYHPTSGAIDGSSSFIMEQEIDSRKIMLDTFIKVNNKDPLGEILNSPLLEQELKVGFAAEVIIQESSKYDLLVVGAKGSGKLGKKVFGSVSIQLAKYAKCPTLIIPESANNTTFRKILYACSNAKTDEIVLPKLISIANSFKATIDILHVSQSANGDNLDYIKEILNQHDMEKSKVNIHTVFGSYPENEINKFAAQNDFDLICFGKHNNGFWHDLFIKSTTKAMTMISDTPLLIIHDD